MKVSTIANGQMKAAFTRRGFLPIDADFTLESVRLCALGYNRR